MDQRRFNRKSWCLFSHVLKTKLAAIDTMQDAYLPKRTRLFVTWILRLKLIQAFTTYINASKTMGYNPLKFDEYARRS